MFTFNIIEARECEYYWDIYFSCGCHAFSHPDGLFVNFQDCQDVWRLSDGVDFIAQMLTAESEPDYWQHFCYMASDSRDHVVRISLDQDECVMCGKRMYEPTTE